MRRRASPAGTSGAHLQGIFSVRWYLQEMDMRRLAVFGTFVFVAVSFGYAAGHFMALDDGRAKVVIEACSEVASSSILRGGTPIRKGI